MGIGVVMLELGITFEGKDFPSHLREKPGGYILTFTSLWRE